MILATALLAEPLLTGAAARAEEPEKNPEPAPPFVLDGSPDELSLDASGADLGELLGALGDEADFAVKMNDTIERTPVEATIRDASADEVLQRVLRRRNYAVVYRAGEVSEVFVLSPPRSDDEAAEILRRRTAAAKKAERAERARLAGNARAEQAPTRYETVQQARRARQMREAREERQARIERTARALKRERAAQALRAAAAQAQRQ